MESHSKVLGHPLHPMMVVFPLGLLATSVAFDWLGRALKNKNLETTGFWMAASGVITGVPTAIPGLIDYLAIPEGTRAKRVGLLHGLGNAVVLGLFAASVKVRMDAAKRSTATSLALSTAAVPVSLGAAWLGGELIDRLGVGVDDHANLNAPNSLTSGTRTA